MIVPALLLLLCAADTVPPEQETLAELTKVRRVYIDVLTGGESAQRIREMLMSSIQASKLFIITEEQGRADAVLKGAGEDKAFTDTFYWAEGINAHSQFSLPGQGQSSSAKYSDRTTAALSIGENDTQRTEERKHEAVATVRLVSKDGDVIWSATEESMGAKFMGASADVVDKITKKLVADYRRAKAYSNQAGADARPEVHSPAVAAGSAGVGGK